MAVFSAAHNRNIGAIWSLAESLWLIQILFVESLIDVRQLGGKSGPKRRPSRIQRAVQQGAEADSCEMNTAGAGKCVA